MVVTTPPPPSSVARTPPTPRHGPMLDDYEPYSPRRTTRTSTQRVHWSKHTISTQAVSPPASTLDASPEPAPSVSADGDTIMSGLGSPTFSPSQADGSHVEHDAAAMMLPTPAKTPRKTIEWSAPALRPTARLLFANRMDHDEDLMPSPRKRRARAHMDMSLDDFGVDPVSTGDPIEIYTDSKERIPEIDPDEDNPFYVKKKDSSAEGAQTTEAAPKSPHKIVNPELAKALKREDGMVFVFRGRKIFCKFDRNAEEDGEPDDDEADDDALDLARRPRLTRSSYKPRILFPTEEQKREREMRDAATEDVVMMDHHDDPLSDIDEDALNMPASAFAHGAGEDEHAVAEMTTTTTTTTTMTTATLPPRVNRSFTQEAMTRVPGDLTCPGTPVAPDFSPITPAFANVNGSVLDLASVDDGSGPVTRSHTKKKSDATVTAEMNDDDAATGLSSTMTVPAAINQPKQKTGPFYDWTRAKPKPKPAPGSPKSKTAKSKAAKSKTPKAAAEAADKPDKGKKRTGGGEGAVEGPVSKRTRSGKKNQNQRPGPSRAKAKKSKPKHK